MNEHAEDPVAHASTKITQYVSLATMAAEAIAQVRQHQAAAAAATNERATAAARAERASALGAARLQWAPVLDPHLRPQTGVPEAGLAWAVAQGWRELDPEAALASERALQRLRELRPDVMDRYDRLTTDGAAPVEAMRRIGPFLQQPAAPPGQQPPHPRVGRDGAGITRQADAPHLADDQRTPRTQELLDTASSSSRQHHIDTGRYLPTTQSQSSPDLEDPLTAGHDARGQRDLPVATEDARVSDASGQDVVVVMARTAPQVAKDGFPEPLTSEVLSAGRVKPKTPASTAPAYVRSNGLATAARASARTR
jgi:hypothetical protein